MPVVSAIDQSPAKIPEDNRQRFQRENPLLATTLGSGTQAILDAQTYARLKLFAIHRLIIGGSLSATITNALLALKHPPISLIDPLTNVVRINANEWREVDPPVAGPFLSCRYP